MKERIALWAAFSAALHFLTVLVMLVGQPHATDAKYVAVSLTNARRHEAFGRPNEAIATLDKITRTRYRHAYAAPDALFESARFHLRYKADVARASADLGRLLTDYPDHPVAPRARQYAELLRSSAKSLEPLKDYFRAVGLARLGRTDESLARIEAILLRRASHPVAPYAASFGREIALGAGDAARAEKFARILAASASGTDQRIFEAVR